MAKQKAPLSLRLDPETEQRLEGVAGRIGIKKHTLAQLAVEAAIAAIEQNEYQIVLPITFVVKQVAQPRGDTEITYPAGRSEAVIIEDQDRKKSKGKK